MSTSPSPSNRSEARSTRSPHIVSDLDDPFLAADDSPVHAGHGLPLLKTSSMPAHLLPPSERPRLPSIRELLQFAPPINSSYAVPPSPPISHMRSSSGSFAYRPPTPPDGSMPESFPPGPPPITSRHHDHPRKPAPPSAKATPPKRPAISSSHQRVRSASDLSLLASRKPTFVVPPQPAKAHPVIPPPAPDDDWKITPPRRESVSSSVTQRGPTAASSSASSASTDTRAQYYSEPVTLNASMHPAYRRGSMPEGPERERAAEAAIAQKQQYEARRAHTQLHAVAHGYSQAQPAFQHPFLHAPPQTLPGPSGRTPYYPTHSPYPHPQPYPAPPQSHPANAHPYLPRPVRSPSTSPRASMSPTMPRALGSHPHLPPSLRAQQSPASQEPGAMSSSVQPSRSQSTFSPTSATPPTESRPAASHSRTASQETSMNGASDIDRQRGPPIPVHPSYAGYAVNFPGGGVRSQQQVGFGVNTFLPTGMMGLGLGIPGVMIPTGAGIPGGVPFMLSRSLRACAECRRRKIKCDTVPGSLGCHRCDRLGIACQGQPPVERRRSSASRAAATREQGEQSEEQSSGTDATQGSSPGPSRSPTMRRTGSGPYPW